MRFVLLNLVILGRSFERLIFTLANNEKEYASQYIEG